MTPAKEMTMSKTLPTEEMIEAGAKYLNESGSGKSGDITKGIYLAMQAVAPDPSLPEGVK